LEHNPFETLDVHGVGELMRIGVERGRATKPGLKAGICGEHGGGPKSVAFCHELRLDYVSCSPFPVPPARVAAPEAALRQGGPAVDAEVRAPRRRRTRHNARRLGRGSQLAREVPRGARRRRPLGGARPDHRARPVLVAHRRQAGRPPPILLTWEQVRARRLARSALTQRSAALVDVARQTCGIHAQVQASAELQLAARVDGIAQQDVRDALWRERTLGEAWALRGPLHLHPADELPLWFATRSPRDELPPWPDPAGVLHPAVSAEEVAELRAAVWDAAGGEPLLREQLVDAVVRR